MQVKMLFPRMQTELNHWVSIVLGTGFSKMREVRRGWNATNGWVD